MGQSIEVRILAPEPNFFEDKLSSSLIRETETSLIIEAYLSGNNDEYDEWQLDDKWESRYGDLFDGNWHHMLDDWRLTLEINKNTGELIKVISIK